MTAMRVQAREGFAGAALVFLFLAVLVVAFVITSNKAANSKPVKQAGTVWQTRQAPFPKPAKPQTVVPIVYLRSV